MSNKKRKAKILRATVAYLSLKAARHERILEIHRTELAGVDAGLKRLLEMYKLLNANKEN
jgi:hypothetical protein